MGGSSSDQPTSNNTEIHPVHGAIHRVADAVLAIVILIVTAPVLLAAIVAIRLESRGPVLVRRTWCRPDGEPFTAVVFRTTIADEIQPIDGAPVDGHDMAVHRSSARLHPHVTRVGRVLRTFSIDELPQVWSVLTGEMTIVGKRATLPGMADA